MLNILAITGPIYVFIGLGFFAGRTGIFSASDMKVLGRFVVTFALPALLFTALSQRPIAEILDVRYLGAYALGSLVMFLATLASARWMRGKGLSHSAIIAMGTAFSNSGFIGYPIALQILGPSAAVALAMCVIAETVLMLPLALTIAEMGRGDHERWQRVLLRTMADLARSPIIGAIVAGIVVSLLAIPVSEPLARTINMLALASTAVALFVIGGSLVGLEVSSVFRDAIVVALGKLLLHPLAVFAALWLFAPADPRLRMAGLIYASVPMLSIYPILGQRFHMQGFCAAALLLATLLSFLTVSGVLWAMSSLLGWTP